MAKRNPRPIPELTQSEIDRFWSLVDKTVGQGPQGECWTWVGGINVNGYGVFYPEHNRTQFRSHRIAYWLETGNDPIPFCLHSCDIRSCVRPIHLRPGTAMDNATDRSIRGRHRNGISIGDQNGARTHPESRKRGADHGMAKITARDVLSIRARFSADQISKTSLAREYGVTVANIYRIVKRITWRHI